MDENKSAPNLDYVNMQLVKTVDDIGAMVDYLCSEKVTKIACDVETNGLDFDNMTLEGVGIGDKEKQFYIPFPCENEHYELLKKAFESMFEKPTIFHNAKFDIKVLKKFNFNVPAILHDTMILSWLVDENGAHDLKTLTQVHLGREVAHWKEVKKEVSLFTSEEDTVKALGVYCGSDVINTYDLFEYFYPQVVELKMARDYHNIERPIIKVLASMEQAGVLIDVKWLKKKQVKIEKLLKRKKELLDETSAIVGGEGINYNSPKQLRKLLFEDFGYVTAKKSPTGKYSTDKESLLQIIEVHKLGEADFVPLLLEYRELEKLYTTYFVGLLTRVNKKNTIHGSFLQHGTRTGRLASRNINFQNIPSRDDEWNIRKAFIARPGYKFLISDYSQMELRVLAHFSQDPSMVEVFKTGGDIHTKTMEITHTKRKLAKALNFGLIYGMGPRTLAKVLKINETDANKYMEKFFAGYKSVRPFIYRMQAYAEKFGFIEMISGRRRNFKNMIERNWRATVARQSINSKIQGSSADIMKIAMIKLYKKLIPMGCKLLVQIHDEIIIECPDEKVDEAGKLVVDIMENAVRLNVPLVAGLVVADHWVKG